MKKLEFVFSCLFIISVMSLASSTLFGQATETAQMTGKEILAKNVEAMGGAEKFAAIKTSRAKGQFQMPDAGINASMTVLFKEPQNALFSVEIPGMGQILKGSNGDVCWEVSAMGGPRILEGTEKEQFLREADQMSDTTPDKYFKSIENFGKKDVDGKECYEVKFTTKGDKEETRFFDAETFLVIKSEQVQETPMGDINVKSKSSDYKEINGVKVPHLVEISMMGQKQVMKIEKVEFNTEIEDSTFDLPEEIVELQQAAEKDESQEPAEN